MLIANLFLISNKTLAQTSFESPVLKSLHYFAAKPTNDNVVEVMKQNKIELKVEKKDRDGKRKRDRWEREERVRGRSRNEKRSMRRRAT